MSRFVFPPPEPVGIAIDGEAGLFPVRRVFCVGRNYAEHAAEMGAEVDREAPFYFTKSACAVIASGAAIPYPLGTRDFHHEVELVVALGEGGAVFGCACGLDMTRRDLQAAAKDKRRPWDTGKDFENSAVTGSISRSFTPAGQAISLSVNGAPRQRARLSDMVWSVPEILAHLGGLYQLQAGDLIFTGTPAGVGAVLPGDEIAGQIEGLAGVVLRLQPRL
jgi:fumarylpyruvate hydrolase